jgi:hypothetical protein
VFVCLCVLCFADEDSSGSTGKSFEISPQEVELLGEPLGQGAFGAVYAGKCRGLNVAVKVLLNQQMDEDNIKSFRKEIEILRYCVRVLCAAC